MDNQDNKIDKMASETAEIAPKIAVELSKVAANPKKSMAIAIVIVLVIAYYSYQALQSANTDTTVVKEPAVVMPKVYVKPTQESVIGETPVMPTIPVAPALKDPDTPKAEAPLPPTLPDKPVQAPVKAPPVIVPEVKPVTPPPPPPQEAAASPISPLLAAFGKQDSVDISSLAIPKDPDPVDIKKREARKKSSIMLIAGKTEKSKEQIEQDAAFKPRSNLEYILSRGKVMEAVIETAINTDFAGEIRAIIARDVYSESGKIVLVPKGSKVYGTFASKIDALYGRIDITWTRIDLPTGYTLTFSGTGVDDLGRKGAQGRLDKKVGETLSNVALSTALNVAFASAIDKLVPPVQTGATATQNQTQASNMQAAIQANYVSVGATRATITSMCTAAQNSITDPTTPAYTQVQQACAAALAPPAGSTDQQIATSLFTTLNGIASSMIVSSAAASVPTKAQTATTQGMTDFSTAMTEIVKQSEPKPTVTIDQGTRIKIYVNKDYTFPRAAVTKSKMLK